MTLTLEISVDRLKATLTIPANEEPALDRIKALVVERGVRFGLQMQVLHDLKATAQIQNVVIAFGQAALPAAPPDITSKLPVGKEDVPVDPDQEIGTLVRARDPTPGMGVDGTPIPPPSAPPRLRKHVLGPGLEAREGIVYATSHGWLHRDGDGLWYVAPEHLICVHVKEPELKVRSDGLEASIELKPGDFILPDELQAVLARNKVAHGLVLETLREVCVPVRHAREVVVARGTPAVNGEDARIEYLVDDQAHYDVAKDGSLDFHEAHKVKEVKAGQPLVKLHPPTVGSKGMTVFGSVIDAKPGKEGDLKRTVGEGASIGQDPHLVVAARNGIFIRSKQGTVGVQQLLVIEGDVDFQCGNLETEFPVLIKGDIKAGFKVKSQGDITVKGVIEDARVSAQGNLSVGKGILTGEQRIKAHGDITALYAHNRKLVCRSLAVAKEVSRCQVSCTGSLRAKEIIGGTAVVAENATIEVLGNPNEESTLVQVGLDPYQDQLLNAVIADREAKKAERAGLDEELMKAKAKAAEAGKKFMAMQQMKRVNPDALKKHRETVQAAGEKVKELLAKITEIDTILPKLEAEIDTRFNEAVKLERKAWCEILAKAYGQVTIMIGKNHVQKLINTSGKATYRLIEGSIRT